MRRAVRRKRTSPASSASRSPYARRARIVLGALVVWTSAPWSIPQTALDLQSRLAGRPLDHDLARAFILAQPLKRRMPHDAVIRPLGESDLADELRPEPMQPRRRDTLR